MKLKELLKETRSYRSFDRTCKVPEEVLFDMVDCVRYAPSSRNAQMLKFRLVTDECECKKVLSATRWAAKLTDIHLPPVGHEPTAYIIVCGDKSILPNAETFDKDVGIASEILMLSAVEHGFGGCIIGSFNPQTIGEMLPCNLVPRLVLALGKPDEKVVLCPAKSDGSVTYYRKDGVHYVEKRRMEDLIV